MPVIDTQGLSEDYRVATGLFEPIPRGEVTKGDLLEILRAMVKLPPPEGVDSCPPSIAFPVGDGDYHLGIYAHEGSLYCNDSQEQNISCEDAAKIICGEITIADFDLSKGHQPTKQNYLLVAAILITIAAGIVAIGF